MLNLSRKVGQSLYLHHEDYDPACHTLIATCQSLIDYKLHLAVMLDGQEWIFVALGFGCGITLKMGPNLYASIVYKQLTTAGEFRLGIQADSCIRVVRDDAGPRKLRATDRSDASGTPTFAAGKDASRVEASDRSVAEIYVNTRDEKGVKQPLDSNVTKALSVAGEKIRAAYGDTPIGTILCPICDQAVGVIDPGNGTDPYLRLHDDPSLPQSCMGSCLSVSREAVRA